MNVASEAEASEVIRELRITWGFESSGSGESHAAREPALQRTPCFSVDAELLIGARGEVQSESLAVGHVIWPGHDPWVDSENCHETMRWLTGYGAPDWAYAPRHLYQGGTANVNDWWGMFVRDAVSQAIGDDRLRALVEEVALDHVRIVFRARDLRSERIPVETMLSPTSGTPLVDQGISILRTPVTIDQGSLHGTRGFHSKRPDSFRSLAVTLDATEGLIADLHEHLAHAGGPDEDRMPPCVQANGFAALRESRSCLLDDADLLVMAGIGSADQGVATGKGTSVSPFEIGKELFDGRAPHRQPTCVVVASCGSAELPTERGTDGRSAVGELARRGALLAIGFQGETIRVDHAFPFVRRLTESRRSALADPDGVVPAGLLAWERAIRDARQGQHAQAAVAYVHPAVLLGRRSARPDARLATRTSQVVTVTAFYVPGQVAWVRDGDPGRLLRMPLPVDIGVRLRVEFSDGGGDPPFLERSLQPVLQAWGLTGAHVRVTLDPMSLKARPLVRGASRAFGSDACWAAELGAVVRALEGLTRRNVPEAVRALLDDAVQAGLGAPDAAPRLIDTETGRSVHEFSEGWEPWTVAKPRGLPVRPYSPGAIPSWCPTRARFETLWRAGKLNEVIRELQRRRNDEGVRTAPGLAIFAPQHAVVERAAGPVGDSTPVLQGRPVGLPASTVPDRLPPI